MKDWKYHCSVLGVRETASEKDVRRAYRRLALERHPDKHNNSADSTLEFQQLHESYEFLLSAIAEGRRPRAAPPPPTVDREAPTDPSLRAPVRRRPTAVAVREPPQWKMWLQMTAAAVLLLIVSVGVELMQTQETSSVHKRVELAARSSCLLKGVKETFDYVTEEACHKKCDMSSNMTCLWNSVVFHGPKLEKTAPLAASAEPEVPCEITMEREAGKADTSSYQHMTEKSCARTCYAKSDMDLRSGIRCLASGKEFYSHPRFVPPADNLPREPYVANYERAVEAGGTTPQLTNTCFFSSNSPDGNVADTFPGETREACQARCQSFVAQHALDTEVRCSYAGIEIVTYVPDGTMAYLSRNPAEQAKGVREGAQLKNTCDIYVIRENANRRVHASMDSEPSCKEHCRTAITAAGGDVQVKCLFGAKEFLP